MPILDFDVVGAPVVVDNVRYGRGRQAQLNPDNETVIRLVRSGHLREVPGQWIDAEELDVEDVDEQEESE